MAFSTTLTTRSLGDPLAQQTDWVVCHNEPDTADNGGSSVLTLAQAESAGNAVALELPEAARHVQIRLRYDDGTTAGTATAPVIEVLAFDSAGAVTKLRNLNGAVAATVSLDASDPEDGTYAYTVPDDATTFDVTGHRWLVVVVKTAFDVADGDKTVSVLEAKPLI